MSRIQWNALAIFMILGVLPFATAIITNAGSSTDGNEQNSIEMDSNGNIFRGYWYDNGGNYTASYQSNYPMPAGWYNCAYIVDGRCGYDYQYSTDTQVPLSSATFDWVLPAPSYILKQSHQTVLNPGEYLGTSGYGPFSFYFYGNAFAGIQQNETLDKISYTFADYITTYNCQSYQFSDLEISADLTFIYENNSKSFTNFEFDVSNKYEYLRYDQSTAQWELACVIGFELEFDFTGFESLDLTSFNNGDWANTDQLIELKNIEREDGTNIGNTQLPFTGDQFFAFTAEHQSVNTVQATFIIKSLTTILSFGTFAVAAASTPYWDPFKNLFKGVV